MLSGKSLVHRLAWLGRPTPGRCFVRTYVRAFDAAFILLPAAAFGLRASGRVAVGDVGVVLAALAVAAAGPLLVAVAAVILRRGDPRRAALQLDRDAGGDRYVSALDSVRRRRDSAFLPLLLRDVWRDLDRRPDAALVRGTLRPPAFMRAALAAALAVLIVLVPPLGEGAFGAAEADERAAAGDVDAPGGADADGAASNEGAFAGRVEVTVTTDRTVYGLGEEITLRVHLRTLEPAPEGVALGMIARVDGEVMMSLPVDWTLPTEPGEELATELPIRDRLKEVGRYRRGLLAIDTFVLPREEREDMRGTAPGNRVVIQIAENTRRVRSRTPSPADRKKRKKQQRKPRKPEEKPPEKPKDDEPQRKPKPEPRGPGAGPPPPGEINADPFVIEPLFSGDQTSKREVPTFERTKKDSDRPPPTTPPESRRTRAYEHTEEVEIEKSPLPGRERRIVRRYLEGLRKKKGG